LPSPIRPPLRGRNSQSLTSPLYSSSSAADPSIIPGAIMLLRMTADGRLLGFDIGDWLVLLCGFVLAGSLALLV
jgi:hypothetical protein